MPFKVTDFGTNRKLIYNFSLVINTNLPRILHRVKDIAFERSKIAIFGYTSWVQPCQWKGPPRYIIVSGVSLKTR